MKKNPNKQIKKDEELKEIELPMRFNPGTLKYEPSLPSIEGEKIDIRSKLKWILIVVVVMIIIGASIFVLEYLRSIK